MSYRNDVSEAKRLNKRSEADQWRLAELTWQNVRPQGTASTRQWGRDTGLSHQHVNRLARTWGRWGTSATRPSFSDAYATMRSGAAREHGGGRLHDTSPATIAKAVAERPDFQRAIARNRDALTGVEDEGIQVRANQPMPRAEQEARTRGQRAASSEFGRRLGVDQVVQYLRGAARDLANAIMAAEEFGVSDDEGEREALRRIRRLLAAYEERGALNDGDYDWLASIGVTMGGA